MTKRAPPKSRQTVTKDQDPALEAALSGESTETSAQTSDTLGTGDEDDLPAEEASPEEMIRTPGKGEKPLPDILPPWHKYGTDEPAGRKPKQFFEWWNGLKQPDQQRLIAYIYRLWPVGFEEKVNARTKKAIRTKQIAKVAGEQPVKDLEDFKRRYGSGEYRIRLNEQVSQKTTICFCHLQIEDPDYPPVISDLAWLDLHHPLNKSFVEYLRFKGIEIPGDRRQTQREEEEEMANTEAIRELTGTVSHLTQVAVDSAQRREPAPVDTGAAAMLKGIEVVQEAGRASIAMVKEAAQTLNRPAGQDPAESMGRMVGMVKDLTAALKPEKDDSAQTLLAMFQTILAREEAFRAREAAMHDRLLQIQVDQINQLRASVEKLLNERQAQATATAPPGSIEELVSKFQKLKEGFRSLLGEDEEDRGSRRGSLLETIVENAPAILQGLGGVASGAAAAWHNAAVARTGQGTPVAVMMPQTAAEIPAPVPAQPGPQQSQEAQTVPEQLQRLKGPLLKALDDGKTGGEFAEDLIALEGQMLYDQIRELGKDVLYQVLKHYLPDVWNKAMSIPQRFDSFVDQFLGLGQAPQTPIPQPGPRPRPQKVVVVTQPGTAG